ncbi:MAG: class I tRNA ligase family protein, partial [bacterium]|nr:class I tRNA ligase family protein [bacterium]
MANELEVNKIEEKVLDFWEKHKVFEKSVERRKGRPPFIFYEGPPTANGRPGIHHFLGRALKDLFGRYKTMRGFYVERKSGWDTHGLPVEIEVEKSLGLKSKKEVEEYGIAKFNEEAKKSVWKYKDEWEKFTKRIGFWIDLKHPYITYDPQYIESVWWVIGRIWKKGLLFKGHKVVPFCTRCGTPLSSHEVAQGYKPVSEPAIYVKFALKVGQKIKDESTPEKTFVMAWTTTPWTLPGNVALAVGEKIKYVLVHHQGENLILAKDRLEILPPGGEVLREFSGKDLVGLEYEPL